MLEVLQSPDRVAAFAERSDLRIGVGGSLSPVPDFAGDRLQPAAAGFGLALQPLMQGARVGESGRSGLGEGGGHRASVPDLFCSVTATGPAGQNSPSLCNNRHHY